MGVSTQPLADPLTHIITATELCRMYGVTKRQVYYALVNGLIRARQLRNGVWLIDRRDLPDIWPTRAA